ncbi:MAG: hypothetical protein GY822_23240 [Deltaproteobacteria bacterium]|nr:hypothetical protein [Deltaproteobacteria bacterium]
MKIEENATRTGILQMTPGMNIASLTIESKTMVREGVAGLDEIQSFDSQSEEQENEQEENVNIDLDAIARATLDPNESNLFDEDENEDIAAENAVDSFRKNLNRHPFIEEKTPKKDALHSRSSSRSSSFSSEAPSIEELLEDEWDGTEDAFSPSQTIVTSLANSGSSSAEATMVGQSSVEDATGVDLPDDDDSDIDNDTQVGTLPQRESSSAASEPSDENSESLPDVVDSTQINASGSALSLSEPYDFVGPEKSGAFKKEARRQKEKKKLGDRKLC